MIGRTLFSAIRFEGGAVRLLDQRLLPLEERWIDCSDAESVALAIETMVVRGAPAIAHAAAFGIVLDARGAKASRWGDYRSRYAALLERMARTRPTAVNLFHALRRFTEIGAGFRDETAFQEVLAALEAEATRQFSDDIATCQAIGKHGLELAASYAHPLTIMTHCNTGALATAGYGTALGVIRSLHEAGKVAHVHVDETRPFLQGARLTAYELKKEGVPFSLNVDGAAAFLMARRKVDWAVVGADRIAANGDTANKIGTYQLAIAAKYHGVKFFVAAPLTTFDAKIPDGSHIPVEDRESREVTHVGDRQMAPDAIAVTNPSFDVTPAALIDGIITEKGVLRPPFSESIGRLFG